MGAGESRPGRIEDKRTSRRENRETFCASIERLRAQHGAAPPAVREPGAAASGLHVCLRKRPIFDRELRRGDFDAITCTGPSSVVVHDARWAARLLAPLRPSPPSPAPTPAPAPPLPAADAGCARARMRPDLQNMYMRHCTFTFDSVFSELADNDEMYAGTAGPLVQKAVGGGVATLFMFGQTGSGKTYTMTAIHERACHELFEHVGAAKLSVFLTYVELAGDRCKDMLNDAGPVKMLTDAGGEVHLRGVAEVPVSSAEELHRQIVEAGKLRATAATGVHDQSSRSHALCRVLLRAAGAADGAVHGSFTMVDLAGTERNKDSQHHDAKLRKETTEINKSLMALKDCVRERAQGAAHISFRKDKLTQLLKSCFTMAEAYTVVIATVSPSCGDTEHTLSTLVHSSQMDGCAYLSCRPPFFPFPR